MKSKVIPFAAAVLSAAAGLAAVRLLGTGGCGDFKQLSPNAPPRARAATPRRVLDVSATYGRVNQTIFNKKTRVIFSKPHEFFSDSGIRSFDDLVFDDLSSIPTDLRLTDGRKLTRKDIALIEEGP